ncbi:hypothetical protein PsorP6_011910 [Peronosclerospora sorghi]|uniref:Uncharacterized protein n=1 Tax=Peronosclerospora sorghi TaxID=230839 RepID=A0ACC0WJK6_9STRA|nr:hypothetical protein PsorP6_011910 [Peronosclerospora sorghi]
MYCSSVPRRFYASESHAYCYVYPPQKLQSMLLRYVRVCDAVYASSVSAGVSRDCVLRAHSGGVVSPKCVILVDHEHQDLVLAQRLYWTFARISCLNNEPFLDGQGHRGMVHATAWLVHHLRDDLRKLSGQYPDYRFVATGHSLGGAIAELSTMQLRNEFPTMQCYAFGTQACVTQKLATDSYDIVTTIVNGYDSCQVFTSTR